MKNYLIIVEGAHDIAIIQKLLKLNGLNEMIHTEKDLPEVWRHTIPDRFPFANGKLDRITPIPSFVKSEDVSVAIKNAGSDVEIMNVLRQTLQLMEMKEIDQIEAVMLVCDADQMKAEEKLCAMLDTAVCTNEIFTLDKTSMELDVKIKRIPLYTYIFPDNNNEGNLENILLQAAEIAYPELYDLSAEYIKNATEYQKSLRKEQNAKKAKIGCIANVMKPGKANQVSIADDDWVSSKTLSMCSMLSNFNEAIRKMIF